MKHETTFIRPEWYYLIVAIPFGIAFLLLTPPVQSPDENAHFFRAFQLSEGRIVSVKIADLTGDELPLSLTTFIDCFHPLRFHPETKTTLSSILDTGTIPLDQSNRTFTVFSNTAIHPPLIYLPQAFGILLARQFTSSVLWLFYAARALNLLAATAIMFYAIRRTPIGKWIFAALALTPMTVFLAASLSSDALTNALSFLVVAHALRCAFDPGQRVSRSNFVLLVFLGIAIGQSKQAYFALPACYLLIPRSKVGSPQRYWLGFGIVMTATLASVAAWGLVVRNVHSPASAAMGLDPRQQLHLILTDPRWFMLGLADIFTQFPMYLCQYIGVLGWLDTRLPRWVLLAELVVLFVVVMNDAKTEESSVDTRQSLAALGIASTIGLTVSLIIYLTWEPPGSRHIHVQGRYYIPAGPLIGLALSRFGSFFSMVFARVTPTARSAAIASIPCLLLMSALCLYDRYFVGS